MNHAKIQPVQGREQYHGRHGREEFGGRGQGGFASQSVGNKVILGGRQVGGFGGANFFGGLAEGRVPELGGQFRVGVEVEVAGQRVRVGAQRGRPGP